MDRLHARYPFLDAAREAVDRADVDLGAVVLREDSPVVERALERVESAIAEGRVGSPRNLRVELLSYPVARVIVSAVGDRDLIRAYATAEAATAHERFVADVENPSPTSVAGGQITVERLLREFDLTGSVVEVEVATGVQVGAGPGVERESGRDPTYRIDVGPYLQLAGGLDDLRWRLVRRDLSGGAVTVQPEELHALLREAVRERVAAKLPVGVPDAILDALGPAIERVERSVADTTPPRGIDVVAPEAFPPCVQALVERARTDEDLPPHSAFSLVGFLTGIGMDASEAATLCDRPTEEFEHRAGQIASENGVDYPPPSCATMDAYGDCVDEDDLCERIGHPMEYYAERVDGTETTAGAGDRQ